MNRVGIGNILQMSEEQIKWLYDRHRYVDEPLCRKHVAERQEVATRDLEILKEVGVDYKIMAAKIKDVIDKANILFEQEINTDGSVTVDGKWSVFSQYVSRRKNDEGDPCYFCDFVATCPREIIIRNKTTGEQLKFRDLIAHAVEVHGYNGREEPFRLEPAMAAYVLDLTDV